MVKVARWQAQSVAGRGEQHVRDGRVLALQVREGRGAAGVVMVEDVDELVARGRPRLQDRGGGRDGPSVVGHRESDLAEPHEVVDEDEALAVRDRLELVLAVGVEGSPRAQLRAHLLGAVPHHQHAALGLRGQRYDESAKHARRFFTVVVCDEEVAGPIEQVELGRRAFDAERVRGAPHDATERLAPRLLPQAADVQRFRRDLGRPAHRRVDERQVASAIRRGCADRGERVSSARRQWKRQRPDGRDHEVRQVRRAAPDAANVPGEELGERVDQWRRAIHTSKAGSPWKRSLSWS